MTSERVRHGSGSYVNQDGNKVYLVTGGKNQVKIDSTEILVKGSDRWTISGPLPNALNQPACATLDNSILCFGKKTSSPMQRIIKLSRYHCHCRGKEFCHN